jgi:hypothetical protein
MSYTIRAIGTVAEVTAAVEQLRLTNTSPEIPLVCDTLRAFVENVEGDDKRVSVDAQGRHSGGLVQHQITFYSTQVEVV